jgi:hypothetical protein
MSCVCLYGLYSFIYLFLVCTICETSDSLYIKCLHIFLHSNSSENFEKGAEGMKLIGNVIVTYH